MANRTYAVLQEVVGESIGMPTSTGRGGKLAGLAINEEIDALNRRQWWFLVALANLTLTTSAKTYSLSTNWPNFRTHYASILLNAAGTDKETDVPFISQYDEFRAGDESGPDAGRPRAITVNSHEDLIKIDTIPGAGYNGRVIRTLYYRKLNRQSISTGTLGVDDSAEDLVIQGAKWRVMRMAKLSGWQEEKRLADEARREMLAAPESVDFFAQAWS